MLAKTAGTVRLDGELLHCTWGLDGWSETDFSSEAELQLFRKPRQRHWVSLLCVLIAGWCCAAQGQQGWPVCPPHLSEQQL